MESTEVLVARHGETYWNRISRWQGSSDIKLNQTGIQQARKLGELLSREKITRIYSSDLQRAVTTATIISGIIGTGPVITDMRLRERGLGKFEGWKSEEVARFLSIPLDQKHILETDELSIENGPEVEPWEKFLKRIWDFMGEISPAGNNGKTLIVAHGGVLRAIEYSLTDKGFDLPVYGNCQFIRLSTDGKNWKIY